MYHGTCVVHRNVTLVLVLQSCMHFTDIVLNYNGESPRISQEKKNIFSIFLPLCLQFYLGNIEWVKTCQLSSSCFSFSSISIFFLLPMAQHFCLFESWSWLNQLLTLLELSFEAAVCLASNCLIYRNNRYSCFLEKFIASRHKVTKIVETFFIVSIFSYLSIFFIILLLNISCHKLWIFGY